MNKEKNSDSLHDAIVHVITHSTDMGKSIRLLNSCDPIPQGKGFNIFVHYKYVKYRQSPKINISIEPNRLSNSKIEQIISWIKSATACISTQILEVHLFLRNVNFYIVPIKDDEFAVNIPLDSILCTRHIDSKCKTSLKPEFFQ